jgi:hypothetical protein
VVRSLTVAIGCAFVFATTLVGPGWTAQASSGAAPAAAAAGTTLYLPNVTKMLGGADGWQTPFIVQNVGTVPTDVTMQFYAFSDGSLVKTRTVSALAPGTSVFHDPNHDEGLFPGGQYSVVVQSAAAPVVTVVNEHQNVSNAAKQEALSYLGLSSGSTKLFLPYLAYNVNGWLTTVIIQNLGAAPTTVTATVKSADGTKSATLTRVIAPGRSAFIDPRVEATLTAGLEYAVTLSADQPIGAVVNAHNDLGNVPAPMGFSYNAITPSSDQTIFLPYVQRNVQGSTTRVIVQNMGTSPATPTLRFRLLALLTQPALITGPSLQPGGIWAFNPTTNPTLIDGEFSMTITGGQFGVLGASVGPTSAAGSTGTGRRATKLYLPNITRTLGGSLGWTTPINLQATGADNATLRWYRFADGALVYTQLLTFIDFGQTIRVDPRALAQLSDDTQYAVVATSESGGIAANVSELNYMGGDGAMTYEAVPQPSTATWGSSFCVPETGAAGTSFQCVFAGLPPGGSISNITFTRAGGSGPDTETTTNLVGVDGLFWYRYWAPEAGQYTATILAAGVTKTATFSVTPQSFPITITASAWGSVTATTAPGAPCGLLVLLPTNQYMPFDPVQVNHIAGPSGTVSFTYTKQPGVSGNGYNFVYCTIGSETPIGAGSYTAP